MTENTAGSAPPKRREDARAGTALWTFVRSAFAKPDGFLIRVRCRGLGHAWEGCYDECCDGRLCWCRRCLMSDAHLREEPCAQAMSDHRRVT